MAYKPISLDVFRNLLEGYRTSPGAHAAVARAAGVDYRTAKKCWDWGDRVWPGPDKKPLPIKAIIAQEQLTLRARMEQEVEDRLALEAELEAQRRVSQRQAILDDAGKASKQELQMVRLARQASMQALAALTQVGAGAAKIAAAVQKNLEDMVAPDPVTGAPPVLGPSQLASMVKLMSNMTTSLKQATDAAQKSMEMERTLAGVPSSLVGHVHMGPISVEEAERRIQLAQRMVQRAKQHGLVVDGGSLEGGPMPGGVLPADTSSGTQH